MRDVGPGFETMLGRSDEVARYRIGSVNASTARSGAIVRMVRWGASENGKYHVKAWRNQLAVSGPARSEVPLMDPAAGGLVLAPLRRNCAVTVRCDSLPHVVFSAV